MVVHGAMTTCHRVLVLGDQNHLSDADHGHGMVSGGRLGLGTRHNCADAPRAMDRCWRCTDTQIGAFSPSIMRTRLFRSVQFCPPGACACAGGLASTARRNALSSVPRCRPLPTPTRTPMRLVPPYASSSCSHTQQPHRPAHTPNNLLVLLTHPTTSSSCSHTQ